MLSDNVVKIGKAIKKMAKEVYSNLGSGFNEDIYQRALAVEFGRSGMEYSREMNIEIYYKGYPLNLDRPDFIVYTGVELSGKGC